MYSFANLSGDIVTTGRYKIPLNDLSNIVLTDILSITRRFTCPKVKVRCSYNDARGGALTVTLNRRCHTVIVLDNDLSIISFSNKTESHEIIQLNEYSDIRIRKALEVI
jgi:hypothetical protein